ncbi:hypothetical protein ACNF49_04355 [Actinomadura sp. ATCC 39365]
MADVDPGGLPGAEGFRTDPPARREGRATSGLLGPALVNLALGVPATLPLALARWLLTDYLPMDCRSTEDLAKPGLVNCNYTTLDHAGIVMFLLAVTGIVILTLVVVVDVVLPVRRGRGLAARLGTAVLILLPFAICLALL